MKILTLSFAFLSSLFAFSQSEYHDYRRLNYDLDAKQPEYRIGRNNFSVGISGGAGSLDKGGGALFFMAGFEKVSGQPEREGYFFSGEIRARAGVLWDIKTDLERLNGRMSYSGSLAGLSIAVRPFMEIFEGNFLYLEGEWGLMYEYIETRIKNAAANVSAKNSGRYIVPQYGVKLGLRAGKWSVFAGCYYFNHTRGVNRLVPKEFKIVDSKEGLGGELGMGFYF
jgi:hypothetical protein